MYLPAVSLMASQHGLLSAAQLAKVGLDPHDVDRLVRGGRLVRLRRGVYVDADAWEGLDPFRAQPVLRMRAAAMSLTSTSYVFSHDSSAIVLGMGAPDPAHRRWCTSAGARCTATRSGPG